MTQTERVLSEKGKLRLLSNPEGSFLELQVKDFEDSGAKTP
ncbi:MAG: hypothetical protein V1921_01215 [Candidatus Altiarchaeota archaeon]